MAKYFSDKTFRYFREAEKNQDNKSWFEDNKKLYLENVREPFSHLVEAIDYRFGEELDNIVITPHSITRPVRPKNKAHMGLVKTHTSISISEKRTSLFEWNPALYFHFGNERDDNFYGVGLWMVSGRQMKLIRHRLVEDHEYISRMFKSRRFKNVWGEGFAGERYNRFPKDYDEKNPKHEFLLHKRFFLHKDVLKKDVKAKNFSSKVIKDLEVAMPYYIWLRETVGKYRKSIRASKDWWQ